MPVFELEGVKVEVDEDGFIQQPETWTKEIAEAIAKTEDVDELTEDHWKVINYLRDYYQQFGIAPMVRKLCKETGYDLKTADAFYQAVAAVEDEAPVLFLQVLERDVGRDLAPAGLGQELALHALGQGLGPRLDGALLEGDAP